MQRALAITLVLLLSLSTVPHPARAQPDPDLARELVAALNAWRVTEGLWPLQPNTTLGALAQQQADYLIGLPDLPDDIHTGPGGETPPERASAPPYNWPDYGRADRVAIGEIGYVGAGVSQAITWWRGSDTHTRAITNDDYREVGVGTAPHRDGHLLIVVLGARPNVLPAQLDPVNRVLYLSTERYRWAGSSPDWVHDVTGVRLFDLQGRPLNAGWQAWQPVLSLPANAGERLYVLYTDGVQQALAEVETPADLVLLPDTLAAVVALAETVTQAAVAGPPTRPDAAPPPPAGDAEIVPPAAATAAPTPTARPTATPTPGTRRDVVIVYDSRSLAVLNASGAAVDLSALVLAYPGGQLAVTAWESTFLNVPLSAFPTGDCLQAWSWNEASDPPKPDACRYLRSILTLNPSRLFWTRADFDVQWNGTWLATCAAGSGECAVALP